MDINTYSKKAIKNLYNNICYIFQINFSTSTAFKRLNTQIKLQLSLLGIVTPFAIVSSEKQKTSVRTPSLLVVFNMLICVIKHLCQSVVLESVVV